MNKDLVSGIALVCIAMAYYLASTTIATSSLEDDFGPHGLPNILAVALGLTGLLLAGRALWTTSAAKPVIAATTANEHGRPLRALGLLIIGFAYVALVGTLGYTLTISLLIASVAWYEGLRPSWGLAGVAIAGGALFWLIFVRLLDVAQPTGLFF